jgi:hypothetical protein
MPDDRELVKNPFHHKIGNNWLFSIVLNQVTGCWLLVPD